MTYISGFKFRGLSINLGYTHFATSAFNVDTTGSQNVVTISLKSKVITYNDSLALLMAQIDSNLQEKTIKNVVITMLNDPVAGTNVYFRTIIFQILGNLLLQEICTRFPDLMIHESSDPLKFVVNTIRFFTNHLLAKGESTSAEIIEYLQKIMSHLRNGKISKDLKSKSLLVPNVGVLKISGHKFLCLSPLREVQKLKDSSHFTLILNYCMVIFLGVLFENWKTFEVYLNPAETGNDQLMTRISVDFNQLIQPILFAQLSKCHIVVDKAQRLGQQRNLNAPNRNINIGQTRGTIINSPDNLADFLGNIDNLELSGVNKDLLRYFHYVLNKEILIFNSEYKIIGDLNNQTMIVFDYETFQSHYCEVGMTIQTEQSELYVLPNSLKGELEVGYRISRESNFGTIVPDNEIKELISQSSFVHHIPMEVDSSWKNTTITMDHPSQKGIINSLKERYLNGSITSSVRQYRSSILEKVKGALTPTLILLRNGKVTYYSKDLKSKKWRFYKNVSTESSTPRATFGSSLYLEEFINQTSAESVLPFLSNNIEMGQYFREGIPIIRKDLKSLKELGKYANLRISTKTEVFFEKTQLKKHWLLEKFPPIDCQYIDLRHSYNHGLAAKFVSGSPIRTDIRTGHFYVQTYRLGQFLKNNLLFFKNNKILINEGFNESLSLMYSDFLSRVKFVPLERRTLSDYQFIIKRLNIVIRMTYKVKTDNDSFIPKWLLTTVRSDFLFHEYKKIVYSLTEDHLSDLVNSQKNLINKSKYHKSIFIKFDPLLQTFELFDNSSEIMISSKFQVFRMDIIISTAN